MYNTISTINDECTDTSNLPSLDGLYKAQIHSFNFRLKWFCSSLTFSLELQFLSAYTHSLLVAQAGYFFFYLISPSVYEVWLVGTYTFIWGSFPLHWIRRAPHIHHTLSHSQDTSSCLPFSNSVFAGVECLLFARARPRLDILQFVPIARRDNLASWGWAAPCSQMYRDWRWASVACRQWQGVHIQWGWL